MNISGTVDISGSVSGGGADLTAGATLQIEEGGTYTVEEDFEATLKRKSNPNSARPRIFDGAAEAKLIALTCSPAPEGFARWSLRLLEEKVVELDIVEKASDNTIGRTVNNHRLKPVASGYGYKPDLVEPRGSTTANAVNFVPFPVSLTKLETCTPSKSEC